MPGAAAAASGARRAFRAHFALYLAVNAALTAINVFTGAPWWAFWPLIVWGFALMVHFLWYRSSTVDEAWVEARVDDLRSKSYDLSHMDDIRDSAEGTDASQARPAQRTTRAP